MEWLTSKLFFPDVNAANPDGIVALGGDLSVDRLKLAYENGIFPWYNEGEPIVWYSPEMRMVLFPADLKITKSMSKWVEKTPFKITFNQDFEQVIDQCKKAFREGQQGTWITEDMKAAYIKLNVAGFAKSVEVWDKEELVGGLYGIDLGHMFCGESMFTKESNASKFAFISLVQQLKKEHYKLIDCQVYTSHLASLGAHVIPRSEFLTYL